MSYGWTHAPGIRQKSDSDSEYGLSRASGHIRAKSCGDTLFQIGPDGRNAGGQVGVGLGTMGNKHAVIPHPAHFLMGRPHTVGHNGSYHISKESEMVICITVKLSPETASPIRTILASPIMVR